MGRGEIILENIPIFTVGTLEGTWYEIAVPGGQEVAVGAYAADIARGAAQRRGHAARGDAGKPGEAGGAGRPGRGGEEALAARGAHLS